MSDRTPTLAPDGRKVDILKNLCPDDHDCVRYKRERFWHRESEEWSRESTIKCACICHMQDDPCCPGALGLPA